MSATAVMRALCGVLASAALMLGSLQQVGAQVPTEFVGVDGLHFVVGNERFYFVGTNNYYAHQFALSPSGQQRVLEVLDEMRDSGQTVLRTWAYSEKFGSDALQPGPYQINDRVAEALDWVIYQAGLRGIRSLLTLTDNWDHYGGIDWYLPWSSTAFSHNDFFTDYTIKDIYKAYFYNLATRVNIYTGVQYRDDPRIFCWELINEPRLSDSTGNILQNWIEEMGTYIKSVDSKHMLSVGVEGFFGSSNPDYFEYNPGGWVTNTGSDFIRNHQHESIDFASAHVWVNAWLGNSGSLSASQKVDWVVDSWVAGHLRACNEILKMPFIMGEFGLPQPLSDRDLLYSRMYQAFEDEATSDRAGAGTLFWLLQDDPYPDFDGNAVYFPAHSSTRNLIVNHANFMNSYKPTIAPLPPSPPSPPPYPPSPPYPPFDGPMPPKLGFSLFEDSFPSGWQEGSWTGGFSVTSYGDEPSVVRVQVSGWGAFTFTSDDAPAAGSNAFSSALYGEASNAPVAISLWMHMPTYSSRGVQIGMFPSTGSSPEWATFLWNPSSGDSLHTSGKSLSDVEQDLAQGWVHFLVDLSPALSSSVRWNRLYFKGFDANGVEFYLDKIWLIAPDAKLDPKYLPFAPPGTMPAPVESPPISDAVKSRLSTPPLKIMPMGDSITAGWPIPGGYREKLYQDLKNLGLNPDMQGSLDVNCGSNLADCDHEGHGGWRIDEIASSLPTFLPLPSTPSADPDVVLVMLGTNDMGQNYFIDQAPERLRSLIENILIRRPSAVVLVATIPPFSGDWNNVNQVEPFNAQIANYVVPSFSSPQVQMVDVYSALNKDTDLADSVHPNKQGADKVADLWLAGIEKLLDDFSVEFPPPPPHAISPPPSPMPPMVDSPPLMAGSPPVASMPPMMPTTGGPPPDVLLICTPAGDNEQGATPPSYYMLSPDLVPVPGPEAAPVDEEASEEVEDAEEDAEEDADEIDEEDEETEDEN